MRGGLLNLQQPDLVSASLNTSPPALVSTQHLLQSAHAPRVDQRDARRQPPRAGWPARPQTPRGRRPPVRPSSARRPQQYISPSAKPPAATSFATSRSSFAAGGVDACCSKPSPSWQKSHRRTRNAPPARHRLPLFRLRPQRPHAHGVEAADAAAALTGHAATSSAAAARRHRGGSPRSSPASNTPRPLWVAQRRPLSSTTAARLRQREESPPSFRNSSTPALASRRLNAIPSTSPARHGPGPAAKQRPTATPEHIDGVAWGLVQHKIVDQGDQGGGAPLNDHVDRFAGKMARQIPGMVYPSEAARDGSPPWRFGSSGEDDQRVTRK